MISRFTFHVSRFACGLRSVPPTTRRASAHLKGAFYVVSYFLLPICLICIGCGASTIVPPKPETMAPDFTLKDQHDIEFHLNQFRGETILLLGCDKDGADQSEGWFRFLNERYTQNLRIQPILNASDWPLFARWFMKGKMKEALREREDDEEIPRILLDWDGEVSRMYAMHPKQCTAVLIDSSGYIRLISELKELESEETQTLFQKIDEQMSK